MHILKSFPELKLSYSVSGPYGGHYRIDEYFTDTLPARGKPQRFFGRFMTKKMANMVADELNLLANLINEINTRGTKP